MARSKFGIRGRCGVKQQTANLAPFTRQPLFPGLEQQIESVGGVRVETVEGNVIVQRDAKGGWVMPERGGWPANFDVVRKAILALAKLDAIEQRTALSQNHGALLLAAPDDQNAARNTKGFRITALDAQQKPLAALILGKVQTPPSGTRAGIAFARRDGEAQTFLVQGDVNVPLQTSDWIDRALFDIAEARIASVTVTPPAGPSYDISRTAPGGNFAISNTPKGKVLVLDELPANIGKAIVLLPLDDAMPEGKIDFSRAFRAEYKMFDGMLLTAWTVLQDKSRWTRFEAGFDAAQAEAAVKAGVLDAHTDLLKPDAVQKQIAEITQRTKGWAFMLPGMKSADLMRDYYDLFKNPEPEKQPEAAPAPEDDMGLPR
jgi:Domain of unknown function (DUF4340)